MNDQNLENTLYFVFYSILDYTQLQMDWIRRWNSTGFMDTIMNQKL